MVDFKSSLEISVLKSSEYEKVIFNRLVRVWVSTVNQNQKILISSKLIFSLGANRERHNKILVKNVFPKDLFYWVNFLVFKLFSQTIYGSYVNLVY